MSDTFQLKGSLFTLSILQLKSKDLDALDTQLAEKIALAPKFFQYAPIVVDIACLDSSDTLDFNKLSQILRQHNLIPVGVKGATGDLHQAIQQAGLAIMTDNDQSTKTQKEKGAKPENQQGSKTLLVTEPIRSGQQVYAQGGDLIVTASISPGSELLADGNIHVYGTLKGRALAGINGDTSARVFCNRLEAELVSIAGHYKIFEDVYHTDESMVKQLFLEEDQLIISSLK